MARFGGAGIAAVLGLSGLWFLSDVTAWLLVSPWARLEAAWFWRLAVVHAIGEALNNVSPLVPFGGEPVKAMLLNRHYRVAVADGVASLVLLQTTIVLAEIGFLGGGFGLMLASDAFSGALRLASAGVLAVFSGTVALLVIAQRGQASSTVAAWLLGNRLGRRAEAAIEAVRRIEAQLIAFYRNRPRRLAGAVGSEFVNWLLGTAEVYAALWFLGFAVSFGDAWMIEAVVVLVRAATFVIPSSLGAQEATFLVLCELITGSATAGVAVALIRRFRELAWTALGLGAGGLHALCDRLPLPLAANEGCGANAGRSADETASCSSGSPFKE